MRSPATSRRGARALLAVAAVAAAVAVVVPVLAGPVAAQSEPVPDRPVLTGTPDTVAAGPLAVSRVDARGVRTTVTGSSVVDPAAITVRADGTTALPVARSSRPPVDLAVVVDNDPAQGNGSLQLSIDALAPLLPGVDGNGIASVTLVTVGGSVRTLGTFTDAAAASAALARVVPAEGGARIWDGVTRAAELLERRPAPAEGAPVTRQVLVLAATSDASDDATASTAAATLELGGVALRALLRPYGVDPAGLGGVAARTGGSTAVAVDDADVTAGVDRLGDAVTGRFLLELAAPVTDGTLELSAPGPDGAPVATTARVVPGEVRTGSAELAVLAPPAPSLVERITSNRVVLGLAALLGLAAVVVAVWTLLTMVVPDEDRLDRRLRAYEEGVVAPAGDEPGDGARDTSIATVAILQRAVQITGDVAQKRGLLERTEVKLERANLPLRAAEALFFLAAAVVLTTLAALALTRNVIVALVVALLGVAVPQVVVNIKVRRRQKAFEAQLPDMLSLMAGTLRAGYSIGQGFEAVSREIPDPMGRELRRVITEHRLGRPLEDALDAVAARMGSEDFAWAVMAIKIQREVGGNLAELLLTVAGTMTERERLRRDVATLTAEGRMSAIVLGFLPPALGAVMYVMNPEYISTLFTNSLGMGMLGLAVVAMVIGFIWMKKIIAIEV